jgi:hypothetical protein
MSVQKAWLEQAVVFALVVLSSSAASAAELDLQVKNEKHQLIWCRVEVRGQDGKMYQGQGTIPSGVTKARGGLPWYTGSFLMNGASKVDLPAGQYNVVVEHGLEYEHFEQQVNVTDAVPVDLSVELKPWIRMERHGWWSADMHVHQPPQDAVAVGAAEDLNLVVLTDRNKSQFFNKNWPSEGLKQEAADRWVSQKNVEDERRGGSWIIDGLTERFPLDKENGWNPPGLQYVHAALQQRLPGEALPWFDIDMPIWWEVPVMVALQTPDSIDIINNQFMQYGIDRGEYWGKPIDRATYPGAQGFVDYTLDLYYRYLNLGFRIAPSAGTGTGVMPSPAGYNRIYAHIDGPFTLAKWYAAVRRGDSFVTNGPILFFHAKRHGARLEAEINAMAREPIARVEIVANGMLIESWKPTGEAKRFHARVNLEDKGYTWIAARCFLATPYTVRLAHSTPIYLVGSWNSAEDARYFQDWIDELIAHIKSETDKRLLTHDQEDALIAMYTRAKEVYEQKSIDHASAH